MGLTMHSPGGGGNRSRIPMWSMGNTTAADRAIRAEFSPHAKTAAEVAFTLAMLHPGMRVVRGAWALGQASRVSRLLRGASYMRRPIHSTIARTVANRSSHLSGWSVTLGWRKKLGQASLAFGLVNPFQNIYYARKKDWIRLAINVNWPLVGVPFYDRFISPRLGAPEAAASPTHHKKTQKRRPYRQRPARPPISGGGPESRPKGVSQGTGRRPRRPRAPGRSKCPPGYYWSWKSKTCVKSKYR